MHRITRTLASAAGATALAVGALAAGTTAVQASPTSPTSASSAAQDCLNKLIRARFTLTGAEGVVIPPFDQAVTPFFHLPDVPVCDDITASIAISRPDGSDLRNQVAETRRARELVSVFTDFKPGWKDAGPWTIRQVAVKKAGVTAVRGFDLASSPRLQVRRASVVEGRPAAGLVTSPNGNIVIQGYLRAWGTDGKQHPLAARQEVAIQVREHGTTHPYLTQGIALTSASGYYRKTVYVGLGRPLDMRVAYLTPYQTIGSSFEWVGVVTNP